ncbi:hypothetical protein K491DRAFT_85425 [Lophiostoma macrostomum CBS 122681]|uniref:F-box domain-containing protein n=1 Tax=Lophiostoma macrostomum CBS 122681 TaxID=1314788 RepID=A0A6A6SZH9_9PLEO|nr:hypothetical protein K491DRAFT_85425 [Lophiostoma macrostomum CBS 122681]
MTSILPFRKQDLDQKDSMCLKSMPPELLFTIFDYLHGADLACLKAACRGFYSLKYNTFLSETECRTFKKRFQADLYARICKGERERPWILRKTFWRRLPCSVCKTTHSRSEFSSLERSLDDKKRACRGALSLFRPCPGKVFTFTELRDALVNWPRWDCNGHYQCYQIAGFKSTVRRNPTMGIECEMKIKVLQFEGDINPDAVKLQLWSTDVQMCPHLRTSTPSVYEELYQDAQRLASRRGHGTMWAEDLGATQLWCPEKQCITRVYTRLVSLWNSRQLYLCVCRRLGRMQSATDPQWRAQTRWNKGEGLSKTQRLLKGPEAVKHKRLHL